MAKQFIVASYDITDDKRRRKVMKAMEDFGKRVQYSVFECLLTREEYQAMRKAVRRVIRPRLDQVRFYPICKNCLRKTIVTSGKEVLTESPRPVIV